MTATIRVKYPFQVHVSDYIKRMEAGTMPRPDAVGVDSWSPRRGERTFGFKTYDAATEFRREWSIPEN